MGFGFRRRLLMQAGFVVGLTGVPRGGVQHGFARLEVGLDRLVPSVKLAWRIGAAVTHQLRQKGTPQECWSEEGRGLLMLGFGVAVLRAFAVLWGHRAATTEGAESCGGVGPEREPVRARVSRVVGGVPSGLVSGGCVDLVCSGEAGENHGRPLWA